MSKESKTSCVDCITDDLMVVRPVSAAGFVGKVLMLLSLSVVLILGAVLLSWSEPVPPRWIWLVLVLADGFFTALLFFGIGMDECIMGNLVGSKVFLSVDKEGRVHLHRRERSLNHGGGPCLIQDKEIRRTVERDVQGVILEIGTGWLRRCRIHGHPTSYQDSPWKQAKTRGRMLEITDRWGSSFRLPIFSIEVDHRWHHVADDGARIILAVLSSTQRGVGETLRHGVDRDKSQAEVAGKIG